MGMWLPILTAVEGGKRVLDMAKQQAIGVGRFSSEAQESGDSRTRQERAFARVCRSVDLEPIGYLFDNGKSAYKGEHLRPDSEFGAFLIRVREGSVRPCWLVWEMVDRFSRMGGRRTTAVAELLINAGFTLHFEDEELTLNSDNIDDKWGEFQKHLEASFKFSRRLSKRMASSWDRKKEKGASALTKRGQKSASCPRWLDVVGDHYVKNTFATTVEECFRLASEGHGAKTINKMLDLGTTDVLGILRNPAVTGLYTPEVRVGGSRVPDPNHPPIPDYYPRVISDELFAKVQVDLSARAKQRGRKGKYCTNLCKELFWGSDGEKMFIKGDVRRRRLLTRRTGGLYRQWEYTSIERGILLTLRDVQLSSPTSPVARFDDVIADLEKRIASLVELQAETPSRGTAQALAALEGKLDGVVAEREKARGTVAPPAALAEFRTLLAQLSGVTGSALLDLRTRIAAVITRLLSRVDASIGLSIHGTRECRVRMTFVDGSVRVFSIEDIGRKANEFRYSGLCGVDGSPVGDSCTAEADLASAVPVVQVTDWGM